MHRADVEYYRTHACLATGFSGRSGLPVPGERELEADADSSRHRQRGSPSPRLFADTRGTPHTHCPLHPPPHTAAKMLGGEPKKLRRAVQKPISRVLDHCTTNPRPEPSVCLPGRRASSPEPKLLRYRSRDGRQKAATSQPATAWLHGHGRRSEKLARAVVQCSEPASRSLLVPACRDRLSAGRSYVSRALIMTSAAAMHGAGAPPCSIQLLSSGRAGMGGYHIGAKRQGWQGHRRTGLPWPATPTPPRRADHACARVPNYLYGASRSRASVSRPCMLHYSDIALHAAAAILQYGSQVYKTVVRVRRLANLKTYRYRPGG